jgi:hypothetical protein
MNSSVNKNKPVPENEFDYRFDDTDENVNVASAQIINSRPGSLDARKKDEPALQIARS